MSLKFNYSKKAEKYILYIASVLRFSWVFLHIAHHLNFQSLIVHHSQTAVKHPGKISTVILASKASMLTTIPHLKLYLHTEIKQAYMKCYDLKYSLSVFNSGPVLESIQCHGPLGIQYFSADRLYLAPVSSNMQLYI